MPDRRMWTSSGCACGGEAATGTPVEPILVPPVCPDDEVEKLENAMNRDSISLKYRQADWLLVESMATWVGGIKPWQCIGHFTFSWEASLDSTRRCFEKFMRIDSHGTSYFYACEQNPSRSGHHVHALLYAPVEPQRKALWELWFKRYGRCRLESVRSRCDVADYCAKYVCKERAWWNVKLFGQDSPDLVLS